MEFRVVKINEEFRNVVVSHKALIEAELEQQKREIISKLEKARYSKAQSRTSLLTVCSSTSAAWTVLSTLPTSLGAA